MKAPSFFAACLGLGATAGILWGLLARAEPGPYAPPQASQACDEELVRRLVEEVVPRVQMLISSGPDMRLEPCDQEHSGEGRYCAITADGVWRWVRTAR